MKHFTDQRGYHDALDVLADVVRTTRQIDGDPQNAAISPRSYKLHSPATLFESIQRASSSGRPNASPLTSKHRAWFEGRVRRRPMPGGGGPLLHSLYPGLPPSVATTTAP